MSRVDSWVCRRWPCLKEFPRTFTRFETLDAIPIAQARIHARYTALLRAMSEMSGGGSVKDGLEAGLGEKIPDQFFRVGAILFNWSEPWLLDGERGRGHNQGVVPRRNIQIKKRRHFKGLKLNLNCGFLSMFWFVGSLTQWRKFTALASKLTWLASGCGAWVRLRRHAVDCDVYEGWDGGVAACFHMAARRGRTSFIWM